MTAREQQLIDICFEITSRMSPLNDETTRDMNLIWTRTQLRKAGFQVEPRGSSHGVLIEEAQQIQQAKARRRNQERLNAAVRIQDRINAAGKSPYQSPSQYLQTCTAIMVEEIVTVLYPDE